MKSISRILLVCPLNLVGHVEETQEEQVERLIGEFQDQNEDVRMGAARALGQIGTPEAIKAAVPVLIQLLQDQNEDVRMDAARALERIGTPEALKAVEEYQSRQ